MKKFDIKEILVPTISLFLICSVVTLLLAVTNSVTAPKIEQLQIETANKTKDMIFFIKTPSFDTAFYLYLLYPINFKRQP